MNEASLNLRDMLANAPAMESLPSAQLWLRITAAHEKRSRRRRAVRLTGTGLAAIVVLSGVLMLSPWRLITQQATASIDWQARAQALELQLDALPLPSPDESDHALNTVSLIAHIDADLQSAYDRGAARETILPLWKRRSELLGTLLAERQQRPVVTDI